MRVLRFDFWCKYLIYTSTLVAIVVGWFATMAAVMLLTNVAPAALVIVSDTSILTSLSRDIRLVRSGEHKLVMTSEQPDYVKQLYAAGAWLVLPSLRNGCVDLRGAGYKQKLRTPVFNANRRSDRTKTRVHSGQRTKRGESRFLRE